MLVPLATADDPRLEDFREIKEKFLERRGLFLAEGEYVVRRLLASGISVRSVMVVDRLAGEIAPLVAGGVPVYVLPNAEVSKVVGFKFHCGVIACGIIPAPRDLGSVVRAEGAEGGVRLVVLPEIASSENLGTLARLAAGLGADAIVIGQRCTSPWMRRTVRVSMGAVFNLPIVQSEDIDADLARLRDQYRLTLVATVLRDDAEILGSRAFPDRLAVLFGTEGPGLRDEEVAACQRKVTIPMSLGVDSLNVGVAAAVVLWEMFKRPR
jgi:tRNA G18 (ribose-2'-O)-methylase SpoU